MKFLKIALLFAFLVYAHCNPVKKDGVIYEILRALPQSDVPIVVVNLDQSDDSISHEEIPLEFPLEKAISVNQMVFENGEWHEVEKPKTEVIIKNNNGKTSWINSDIPSEPSIKIERVYEIGSGIKRKDIFDSEQTDETESDESESESPEEMSLSEIKKIARVNSQPSMSASYEDRKIDSLESDPSMSVPVDRHEEMIASAEPSTSASDEVISVKKIAEIVKLSSKSSSSASTDDKYAKKIEESHARKKMINKMMKISSEASMSASVEAKSLREIAEIASFELEPSMSASDESKKEDSDEEMMVPLEDAHEIDLIINDEKPIIEIERNPESNEISYNLIDSDFDEKPVKVKTSKLTDEEEAKIKNYAEEKEKQRNLFQQFYNQILGSILSAMIFGQNPFSSTIE